MTKLFPSKQDSFAGVLWAEAFEGFCLEVGRGRALFQVATSTASAASGMAEAWCTDAVPPRLVLALCEFRTFFFGGALPPGPALTCQRQVGKPEQCTGSSRHVLLLTSLPLIS